LNNTFREPFRLHQRRIFFEKSPGAEPGLVENALRCKSFWLFVPVFFILLHGFDKKHAEKGYADKHHDTGDHNAGVG
jgi:hypothetical protein